jgi:hypothetical protein
MAQDPRKPKDDGKLKLPPAAPGMNKTYSSANQPPGNAKGGKAGAAAGGRPGGKQAAGSSRESGEADVVDPEAEAQERKNARARQLRHDQKIVELALKRFKRCLEAEDENRKKALEDLKFKAGDQWPADVAQQRSNDKRPCLTINTLPTLVHQVTNDLRQNRPSIAISPVSGGANREGARAFAGMVRAIERDSQADIAYDTAVTSAVDIGFGYWRYLTEFENDHTFNKVIKIMRIRNSFRVYLDPQRQEPDGCDATFGFISDLIARSEYNDTYPDADPLGWNEKGVGDDLQQWIQKDFVRVAEYFTLEHELRRLVMLSTGHVGFYDDLEDALKKQVDAGEIEVLQERQSEVQKVMWRKITGRQVLDTKPWDGRWIPIVEVVGEEIDVQGKVIRSGMIRNTKDPMRMKNYWATAKTEMVALAPRAPWVGAEGQFEGHETEWENAHIKMYTKLEYVPVVGENGQVLPPPQRQPMVGVPEGVVQAEQGSQQDLMATTGVRFDMTGADRLNDESGLAVREVRRNMDLGSFHYYDNFCRSLRHGGRILVDLIPKTYDTERVVTILQEDDSEEQITLSPEAGTPYQAKPNQKDPIARKIFDPTVGTYGVTVTIGPSYATKRIEARSQLMEFARALPQKGELIAHLIAKYSDWPGADEAYKILLKALPPNLIAPDPKDLPPQVATFVQSLMRQVSQLMGERVQLLKDLTDQRGDRAVKQQKIDRDFEAKLLKIFTDAKTKLVQVGAEDARNAVAITDETRPLLPDGASAGGVPEGRPQFPPNGAALPTSPVTQPGFGAV